MVMRAAIYLVADEGAEDADRQRVRPQLVLPERRDHDDLQEAVRDEVERSKDRVGRGRSLRRMEHVGCDDVVWVPRELVLAETYDDRVHCRRLDEPDEDAAN